MDKQQAKFILSSFRPDGADANTPEFAEALHFAAEDRELGEWLAQERAADAAFAKALNEVPIPDGLRDEILAVLEYDGQVSDEDGSLDALFVGGMTAITPPEGLREQILAAMEVEQGSLTQSIDDDKVTDIKLWRWLSVTGIAAAVAVATFITIDRGAVESAPNSQVAAVDPVQPSNTLIGDEAVHPVAVNTAVQQMAAKLKQPEQIDLNKELGCAHDAKDFLGTQQSPVPETLPPGLEGAKLLGARNMLLADGQPVSLICFEKEGMGMVHLIVLDTKNLEDADDLKEMKSISLKNCYGCNKTKFNVVHWKEGDKAYMMLTKAKKKDMVNLF